MCGCLLQKRKAGRESSCANGGGGTKTRYSAPGERNAVERLILTERDDFPWSSLRTNR